MKNKRKNLEEVIRNNVAETGLVGSEFVLRVTNDENNELRFLVHPLNRDGETRDFILNGNKIKHDYSVKYSE